MASQHTASMTQSSGQAAAQATCSCCGSTDVETVYQIRGVPTNSCILLKTREEALAYPRGDIRLGFCGQCGFMSNLAFDPALTEYSGRYEETQAFSATFNSFHEQLARGLVERHGLKGRDILEIGCGKGEFLKLICEEGENRGLGFDPGYSESRGDALGASRFRVIRDFFSERYAEHRADFVCSKMTLEHIPKPYQFLKAAVRVAREPDGIVFIQVPESLRIVRDCAFEDIYYEHCSYFTAGSLARLFGRLGLDVIGVDVAYDDQYLTIEGKHANSGSTATLESRRVDDLAALTGYLSSFKQRTDAKLQDWRERIVRWKSAGKRVAIWGSGSKGVSFLHAAPADPSDVSFAVDINPYRDGYFMPGTGHEIVGPGRLAELRPDAVIVMNRIYVPEIRQLLGELSLTPELASL